MRQSLVIVATGLVAGTVGAVLAGRMTATSAAPPGPSAFARPPAPIIVPPGWDPDFAARLGDVEKELGARRAAAAPSAAHPSSSVEANGAPYTPEQREAERVEHYQKEVAYHTRLIAEHAGEAVDREWAWGQGQEVRKALDTESATTTGAARPQNIDVDCRTKTCVAKLTFPSPMEGLGYLHSGHVPIPEGCNGMTSTPLPPRGAGAYDLSIVYTCRK